MKKILTTLLLVAVMATYANAQTTDECGWELIELKGDSENEESSKMIVYDAKGTFSNGLDDDNELTGAVLIGKSKGSLYFMVQLYEHGLDLPLLEGDYLVGIESAEQKEDGKSRMGAFICLENSTLLLFNERHEYAKIFKEKEEDFVSFLSTGDKFTLHVTQLTEYGTPLEYKLPIDCSIPQSMLEQIK